MSLFNKIACYICKCIIIPASSHSTITLLNFVTWLHCTICERGVIHVLLINDESQTLSDNAANTSPALSRITAPTPPAPSLKLKPVTFILKQLASGGNHFTGSKLKWIPCCFWPMNHFCHLNIQHTFKSHNREGNWKNTSTRTHIVATLRNSGTQNSAKLGGSDLDILVWKVNCRMALKGFQCRFYPAFSSYFHHHTAASW